MKNIFQEKEEKQKKNKESLFQEEIDEIDECIIGENINLEGVLLENIKNLDIIKTFGNNLSELAKLAETWWETTHSDNLNHLDDVFQAVKNDPAEKIQLKKALR